jgi:two-component system phosphate regulon response regulator PhoB
MDGIEICRAVRRSAEVSPPYVLLLTARAQKADVQKGLAAGADDYLIKPYDPEELRGRLLAACQQLESTVALAPVECGARCDPRMVAVRQS